jgi:hypothetical protein
MTDPISPAAQAVLNAYQLAPIEDELTAAAVLRAVVQELKYFGVTEKNILAIAAELEGRDATTL